MSQVKANLIYFDQGIWTAVAALSGLVHNLLGCLVHNLFYFGQIQTI